MCGTCVVDQSVNSPVAESPRRTPRAARSHSNQPVLEIPLAHRHVRLSANNRSMSPSTSVHVHRFVPNSSWTSGAPHLRERGLRVDNHGQRLVLDLDQLRSIPPRRRDSSSRSPRRRHRHTHLVDATGLCSGALCPPSEATRTGSEPCHSSAMSAPDHAPTTSACASAGVTSTFVMRACAYGLRTTPR